MLKKCLIGIAVLILPPAVFVMDTIIDSGAYKTIEPHFAGSCSTVEGVVGAEDITIDPTSGLAFISAHDRRNWSGGGGIYTYQTGSYSKPTLMSHDLSDTFYPHGVSLWKNPHGADRLFVVNHPPSAPGSEQRSDSEVIIFDIIDGALKRAKTFKTDLPYSLNDVAAINSESFYATIDKGSLTRFGRLLESFGRLARGGIAYGNNGSITKLTGDLTYPNGIQVSLDSSKVYVSESTGERLLTYARDNQTGKLQLIDEMTIDSGLDNLEWDSEGNLWVAGHPQMLKYLEHSKNHANLSASQVLRVNVNDGMSVDEIYLNNGEAISGSSVGAPYQDHVLIGSVFEPFILDCKRDSSMKPQ
ncbi:hypothetical protein CWC22_011030 [Pseudoalteromonas rubra]|uniref:SMP-30/Gluconolactonase/LRE-like region domain-containing protein n=1 Tax=Pseudoalteromonas rubra TaxID=43658 RepID=A0A5S3V3W2_9GAMM|nr:SMP-30/gluconolactonase/LRE family protein [Pseudoalteromonas rubra]QPB83491.1 hypothetical protein CWC22_011030 [Pseudoalteromonas rubra]